MQMDYYAYEYSVIKRLMDIFKIESVEHNKSTEDYKGLVKNDKGKLEYKTIETIILDDYIKFDFKNNFNFRVNTQVIKTAFKYEMNIEDVVNDIKSNIENKWLKEIRNDN